MLSPVCSAYVLLEVRGLAIKFGGFTLRLTPIGSSVVSMVASAIGTEASVEVVTRIKRIGPVKIARSPVGRFIEASIRQLCMG